MTKPTIHRWCATTMPAAARFAGPAPAAGAFPAEDVASGVETIRGDCDAIIVTTPRHVPDGGVSAVKWLVRHDRSAAPCEAIPSHDVPRRRQVIATATARF